MLLICISLLAIDVDHILMCCHLCMLCGEMSVQIFCSFSTGLFVFSLLSFECSLYRLDESLCKMCDLQIFSYHICLLKNKQTNKPVFPL